MPFFRVALQQAQMDQELHWREQAEMHAPRAFEVLREILDDPKASASARRNAAKDLIEWASCPLTFLRVAADPCESYEPESEKRSRMHNSAHPAQSTADPSGEKPPEMHNSAHPDAKPSADPGGEKPPTFRREGPKIGRNDPCPCGSGKKFKHCCLGKAPAAADSAAAA